MVPPEALREQLVDQIVGGVLDHLDLFEDHLLLALDVLGVKGRVEHEVRQHVESRRQMLVEHLDVVARVLLRGEGVQVPAEAVDLLRDVLGAARRGALEEHVLHKVRDAAVLLGFVPRATRQPHPDRDRPHVVHLLGDETDPVREDLADYHVGGALLTR